MNPANPRQPSPTAPPGDEDDPGGAPSVDALRASGANRFDPVRFRFIEALARRTAAQGGQARPTLDRRLAEVLAAYAAEVDRARLEVGRAACALAGRFPDAAADFGRLQADGDVRALRRLAARLEARDEPRPLSDLLRHIDLQAEAQGDATSTATSAAAPAAAPAELRALRQFRSTWTRLGVDRQLRRSLRAAPDNPGPLNSHLLVLRALRQMQDISPAYLDRFMSHGQALLWLDQARLGATSPPAGAARRDGGNPRKPARRGTGKR